MTDTATVAPTGSSPAPNATPAGAFAYFTGTDGSIAWLDLPASFDEPPVGFLRLVADKPESTLTFADSKAWAAEVDQRSLKETEVPANGTDPAPDQPAPTTQPPAGGTA